MSLGNSPPPHQGPHDRLAIDVHAVDNQPAVPAFRTSVIPVPPRLWRVLLRAARIAVASPRSTNPSTSVRHRAMHVVCRPTRRPPPSPPPRPADRAFGQGLVYRRPVRVCTTCDQRLDTTAARQACEAAGHPIDVRAQRIWWMTYEAPGRRHHASSHSEDRQVADDLLQARARPSGHRSRCRRRQGPATFDDAADEIVADYQMNKKRSLRTLTLRIEKHLRPFFGHQLLTAITTPVVRTYITRRQAAGASNATINRDLITLKRMFTLAVQGGTLPTKPYIPLLKE